jgi:hypothetical protein
MFKKYINTLFRQWKRENGKRENGEREERK